MRQEAGKRKDYAIECRLACGIDNLIEERKKEIQTLKASSKGKEKIVSLDKFFALQYFAKEVYDLKKESNNEIFNHMYLTIKTIQNDIISLSNSHKNKEKELYLGSYMEDNKEDGLMLAALYRLIALEINCELGEVRLNKEDTGYTFIWIPIISSLNIKAHGMSDKEIIDFIDGLLPFCEVCRKKY